MTFAKKSKKKIFATIALVFFVLLAGFAWRNNTVSNLDAPDPTATKKVLSRDGTSIAYETMGQGPVVILVDGAMCHRALGPARPLATLLGQDFTVWIYDRRGRGASGNNLPYVAEREIEDLAALTKAAGGSVFLYGISSGGALALEAANRIQGVQKLALYEIPFIVDDTRPSVPDDFVQQLGERLSAHQEGEAVKMFMRQVGAPGFFIALLPIFPGWPDLKAVAHTLPYDFTVLSGTQAGKPLPAGRWTGVRMPTLVMSGGESQAWMVNAARATARILPNAQHRTIEGQDHMLDPEAIAPVLVKFFKD